MYAFGEVFFMIAYVTFLLIILALSYPVGFIVTLIVELFRIKKHIQDFYDKMNNDSDLL